MENTTPVVQTTTKPVDTHSYKGWLNSDKFLKRCLAIYGYSIVAAFIIMIPLYIIIFIVAGIFSVAN